MKIALTGSSGFIGQQIVPVLEGMGADLLLLGRNPDLLRRIFPNRNCAGYDMLAQAGLGFDAVLHLAVLNNDSDESLSQFTEVNVNLTCQLARYAAKARITVFINLSSFHALEASDNGPYAVSKRRAAEALRAVTDIRVINVFLPPVYGSKWSGRLSRLNHLPRPLANTLFWVLSAAKPVAHVNHIARFLMNVSSFAGDDDVFLADSQESNRIFGFVKRVIDLSFALAVGLLLFWLLAIIWIVVILDSGLPGIFAQQRVGRGGKAFTCYKFRSMNQATEQMGTHEISGNVITGVGRVLRSTKLDELPQIINIVRNELSLVGPRPCLPVQTALIKERRERGVLTIKPGITGLAQINDIDMSDPARLARWDARYLATRSITEDVKIIVATFIGRGRGDRVRAATEIELSD